MIQISRDFDLGRDATRIKDPRDAKRQRRTVEITLKRLYGGRASQQRAMQLVADEVGMGKTFVALGVAYSVLAAMRSGNDIHDLEGCTPRVLVIAPQNSSLVRKWGEEVREFVRRCIPPEQAEASDTWFTPQVVDRLDDLALALRRRDARSVIVTNMGVLAKGKKLQDYDLKRRFMLGVLFRYWGTRFQRDARERLLRGAPDGWPRRPDDLTDLDEVDRDKLPFASEEEALGAIRSLEKREEGADVLEALLEHCRRISEPHMRARDEHFPVVEKALVSVYRAACFAMVKRAIPLVVVDEAHHWKNGPRQGTNGYNGFRQYVAPFARRALLLTATPFQLRPDEMLELLKVGSALSMAPTASESEARRAALDKHREETLRPVLENSARQSRIFAKAWGRLPPRTIKQLESSWTARDLTKVRLKLRELAIVEGVVDSSAIESVVEGALAGTEPEIRELLREGLRLYTYNQNLSQELGEFVIRHRRRADHRLVRVGSEFVGPPERVLPRSDRSVLHAASGIDVRGDAELPHYLLMRCVSEMKGGKGRSSLGSALTGCYSTLLDSAEGKSVRARLAGSPDGEVYLDLLLGMVNESKDPEHPKVRAVVESVLQAWRAGEKSLLFCFRVHTARRLQQILGEKIRKELNAKRDATIGGAEALKRLRGRFTRRDGELANLMLDRVLYSLRWAGRSAAIPFPVLAADDLLLGDDELRCLAELGLRYKVDLSADLVDRVFLTRATEHILAGRIRRRFRARSLFSTILDQIADESWVRRAYGIEASDAVSTNEDAEEIAGVDERGVHTIYTERERPSAAEIEALAADLVERRQRARRQDQISIFDGYALAPSFWLGRRPEDLASESPTPEIAKTLEVIHVNLFRITHVEGAGLGSKFQWNQRRLVMQALRRAALRDSVLLRVMPERVELAAQGWAELLVERLFAPLPGQRESMAQRLSVFVEDIQAASGDAGEAGTRRNSFYEATRMRGSDFVVLVDGSTDEERRERVFAGFNTPLLPEVLICTTVGQEGIDLHRHCRNVVHYDLAWNPAVLEQRTGRVDRIGSKTFRERASAEGDATAFLDVGVPFLAGTYDERMYEEIRIRAQTFEVLTGGDVAADNLEGVDTEPGAEGREEGLAFPMLPQPMVADLRVRLHVWEPE